MTMTTTTTDYERAVAMLNGRQHKKVANNTYARLEDGNVVVKLHDTDILTFRPNGEVVYNSGGWLTVTTKERMNTYGAERVVISQTKGRWFVCIRGSDRWAFWQDGPTTDYYDGLVIREGQVVGKVVHSGDPDRKVKAQIAAYVKGYTDEEIARLVADAAEHGTSGDCWYCGMVTTEGKPLGDAQGHTEHLLSHLDEGYRMATLMLNAVTEAGYRNPGYILHGAPDMVRRSIKKYLMARLATNTARRIPGGGGWGGVG